MKTLSLSLPPVGPLPSAGGPSSPPKGRRPTTSPGVGPLPSAGGPSSPPEGRRPTTSASAALLAALLASLGSQALAGIPEPGVRLFGTIALNGTPVGATDTAIVVEARKTPTGPAIASYRMGSQPAAGNFFSLILAAESAIPLTDTNSFVLGSTVHLVVRDASGDREFRTFTLSERGLSARVNFGSIDTDGDGMSDVFESTYFGSATGGNSALDTDLDGRPNFREFLQGTNPLVPDGRHPADLSPADNNLTLTEVTAYILAWKTGGTWPVEPALNAANVEDYVTRAGALWKGGEAYVFDNDPVTTAPLWWINGTVAGPGSRTARPAGDPTPEESSLQVSRRLPAIYRPNQPVAVSVSVSPRPETRAYALVETPPEGWSVRNLSHEGRWDATNRKIKWGPFFDPTPRTFTYDAVPMPAAAGSAQFAGRGSFDGLGVPAAGPLRAWPPGQTPAPGLKAVADASGMRLELQGEPGRAYLLRSSENLTAWDEGDRVTLDSQGFARLPMAGGSTIQFYTLRPTE